MMEKTTDGRVAGSNGLDSNDKRGSGTATSFPVMKQQPVRRAARQNVRSTMNNSNNRRRSFSVGGMQFRCWQYDRLLDMALDAIQSFFEMIVYLLGPLLIVLALGITSILAYAFFDVVLPMMWEYHENSNPNFRLALASLHCTWVVFLLVNVLFNYFMCVTTRNAGKNYERVVRELAAVTGFVFPDTPVQKESWRQEYEDKMALRIRRRREREQEKEGQPAQQDVERGDALTHRKTQSQPASPAKKKPPPTTTVRRWMLMGPYEWGYCNNSNQPKPPRSHYDHVTKRLVLNLDHYCPWMFNSIGYFNYRYFVNFLIYIFLGMSYGAVLTFKPFMLSQSKAYRKQRTLDAQAHVNISPRLEPMLPHRDEKMMIQLSFMLCAAVGCAIMLLGGFHVYLVLTAQTTIEFHGNWNARRKARKANKKWRNPYDQGWRKNWKRVYGDLPILVSLLPSIREPEYLPVPIPGKNTRRSPFLANDYSACHDENQLLLQEGSERQSKVTPLLPNNTIV